MATSSTPVHPEYAKALKDIAAAKPVINFLTILAGDHSGSAASIAETIVQYAEKSPKDGLALLYLSDSIIKNVGGEYRQAFSQRILPFFVGLYGKVRPSRSPLAPLPSRWPIVRPAERQRNVCRSPSPLSHDHPDTWRGVADCRAYHNRGTSVSASLYGTPETRGTTSSRATPWSNWTSS